MNPTRYQLVLCRPGFSSTLAQEFADRWGIQGEPVHKSAVRFPESTALPPLASTVFARQYLPMAMHFENKDLQATVDFVFRRIEVMSKRGNRQLGHWTLHAFAIDDDPGLHHAMAIEKKLLAAVKIKLPELYRRYIKEEDFLASERSPHDLVVQIYAPSAHEIWLSIAPQSSGLSPHMGGIQRMKKIHGAPSRSTSKLAEGLQFMGVAPKAGETAVDLGAAPGGWTFLMATHGVDVTAIDHAELDLPHKQRIKGNIEHLKTNGLKFLPETCTDWLCCDMVMGAEQTLEVLDKWLAAKRMRAFVVNIKLPQDNPWPAVKKALTLLTKYQESGSWPKMFARHLYHDRNEITLMGLSQPSSL